MLPGHLEPDRSGLSWRRFRRAVPPPNCARAD